MSFLSSGRTASLLARSCRRSAMFSTHSRSSHITVTNSVTPSHSFSSSSTSSKVSRIGLVGARGHTGSELISLIARHPELQLTAASSRALIGQRVNDVFFKQSPQHHAKFASLTFSDLTPQEVAARDDVDVWILALPNDLAPPFVNAIDAHPTARHRVKLVDLSADYRFHTQLAPSSSSSPASSQSSSSSSSSSSYPWIYGLPERAGQRALLRSAHRVSNPGCYATASQLSLLPLISLIDPSYPPIIFGVSGYSGAGTTPSRRNDPKLLHDNIMPYSLVNHMHEREISFQLAQRRFASRSTSSSSSSSPSSLSDGVGEPGLTSGVRFMPHVASFFRGIQLTLALTLKQAVAKEELLSYYHRYYTNEPFVKVVPDGFPEVASNANQPHACIGGITVDKENPRRVVVCATIDNLLKGAASQCIQNINLMQGYTETKGILP